MSVPRYKKYKDSGVEWLGEVPDHWRVGAIKYFVLPKNGAIKTGPFGSHLTSTDMQSGTIKVYNQRNVIDSDFTNGDNFISEKKFAELASFEVFPGDLLITTRGTIGKTAILPDNAERGILHPCLLRLQPDNSQIDTRFLKTLIQESDVMKTQLSYLSNATTIEVIYSNKIASVIIAVPSTNEQYQILAFLDRETSKIDDLVGEQRRLIELLTEKRQAVISHAVTKGLNPHAPMKPSNNQWLGDVPAHWTVARLKHVKSDDKNAFVDGPFGSNLKSEHFIDNGDAFVIESNFATQGQLETAELKTISLEHFETVRRSEAKGGDIIIAKIGAQFGKSSILPTVNKPAVVSGNSLKLTVNCEVSDVKFVNWHLTTLKQLGVIDDIVNGTAQPALSLGEMNNLPMLIPPLAEQQAIITELETQLKTLDDLMSEAQRGIDLLQERRTALISAAVTGKIDVRGLVETGAT